MKVGTCARDRRVLQQLALNVHIKHSDLTCITTTSEDTTKKNEQEDVNHAKEKDTQQIHNNCV